MQVEYAENMKIAFYNGERFTRDDRTGYYLSARRVPETGKRIRLHKYVWLIERGEIPKGCQIHHIDEDKSHNDIDNLACLSEHDHLSYHSQKFVKEHYDEAIKAMDYARIYANKWHGSDAGKRWHQAHYEQFKELLHVERDYVCEFCGKEYKSTGSKTRFCGNNCRAAARRKSGVDDIKVVCAICGKEFMTNKYASAKTCSLKCKNKLIWQTRTRKSL